MASLEALSALRTVTSFLYNVIGRVKDNTSECRETLDLVFLFISDIEQSGIQNVSLPMQERIVRLLSTFFDLKADIERLEQKSLLSRTFLHEQIASKLCKVRRVVEDARSQLLLRVQLETYVSNAGRTTRTVGPCGFMPPSEWSGGHWLGTGYSTLHATPAQAVGINCARPCSDHFSQRMHVGGGHVRRLWNWLRRSPRANVQRDKEAKIPQIAGKDQLGAPEKPSTRPISTIGIVPLSTQQWTNEPLPRKPMDADCGAAPPTTRHGCDSPWQEPCITLLSFTDEELSEGLGLRNTPEGIDSLRKHLKLLADNDSAMEHCLLRAWYAVDHRKRTAF